MARKRSIMTVKRSRSVFLWVAALSLALVVGGVTIVGCDCLAWMPRNSQRVVTVEKTANHTWATPVQLTGVDNCFKVSDTLYRGEQPTADGFKELEQLGIKTVINLRALHSDQDGLKGLALDYEAIPLFTWDVETKDAVRFLKIATDPAKTPVFVHCQHGSDRTGTMCALYRMAVEGWPKQEAIDEMTQGGFGFHGVWINLVAFLQTVDIASIQDELKN